MVDLGIPPEVPVARAVIGGIAVFWVWSLILELVFLQPIRLPSLLDRLPHRRGVEGRDRLMKSMI
jgi:hypothetical protein